MRNCSDELRRLPEEEKELLRLKVWSWYIRGARDMILRLREHLLLDESHPECLKVTKDDKIINKAVIDMLLQDKRNIDFFLSGAYEIRLKDHEKDKKGKLVKCTAFFARRVIKYEEV